MSARPPEHFVQVRYLLEPEGAFAGDSFHLRVLDPQWKLSRHEKIELLRSAITEFLKRFPEFELQKPAYVEAFLEESKGDGVIWFQRKTL